MKPVFRTRPAMAALVVVVWATQGCGGSRQPPVTGDRPLGPGAPVSLALPADRQAEQATLVQTVASAAGLDGAALVASHAVPFAASLGYDPLTAINMPLVQGSSVALQQGELDILSANGFVLSDRQIYPGFTYGYATIYSQDLPVFISADSILHALHRSYDDILKELELSLLVDDMGAMLDGMRARLGAGAVASLGDTAASDADLYLAVARSLLADSVQAPVAGASAAQIGDLFTRAKAAAGTADVTLFGSVRTIDFSQFTPRGHYKGVPLLEQYFRATMWLGRTDLPIIDVDPVTGQSLFRRQMLNAALALSTLLQGTALPRWQHIDGVLNAFVGEPDAMEPPDVTRLLADLQVTDAAATAALSDDTIAQAIISGGYGQQRIASQIIIAPPHATTLPLAATFLLLGQRYVVDSQVFSNVVYDRVQSASAPKRMMPSPLDVAFAALGNDTAAPVLQAELDHYQYAPDLERMRRLVDAYGPDFWSANLYNLWLTALRSLSPSSALQPAAAALPAVATTEAWGRRTMNTQLASWAELRHDTILYAKQSYTTGVLCDFPDAYVEPNPAFFAAVAAFAQRGSALLQTLDFGAAPALGADVTAYFGHLGDVAQILGGIATGQQTGAALTAAQLDFVNQAVHTKTEVCGAPPIYDGWYPTLFFRGNSGRFDPTIADVHTEPTDENGAPVGRVLHVGTGYARLMVMTVEACDGPHAYVGLGSSYHEQTTQNYLRLDDTAWAAQVQARTPANVPWLSDLLGPR
jgi:Protein of unknown function (DUF3160)